MQTAVVRDPLDPFPWYAAMRSSRPVFLDPERGAWHVFGYADVQRVLSDHAVFSSERGRRYGAEAGPSQALSASVISTDPPRHRQLRGLVSQAFSPRAIDAMAPRISSIVDELLDAVVEHGEMDFIRDFAYPLPVIVIAQILGIPPEERDQFKHWSDAVVTGAHPNRPEQIAATRQAHVEMGRYFMELIEYRKRQPGDDLISGLLTAEIEGQRLSTMELLGFAVLLLIAGNETTTNLLGNAVLCFDGRPDQMDEVRRNPELLPGAIEEVLRYRSPVQSMFRTAAQDVTLGGQRLHEDDFVIAWIGSANHDESIFPDPERFDVHRAPTRHLAFGHGVHFCLGAPLARLEARIGLKAVLERAPDLHRVPGRPLTPTEGQLVYGVKSLPVAFRPA